MKKPRAKIIKALNFFECQDFIEKKHEIDIRDYARSHSQFAEWCESIGEKPDGNSREQYARFSAAIANGEIAQRPYQDWWHWLLDVCDVQRGGTLELDAELGDDAEPWQKEILALFLKEFGRGPYLTDW